MAITVADIVQYHDFQSFRILAGAKGLNHHVTLVTMFDAPDFYKYLHGGEFLLTTGYIYREQPLELCEAIRRMHAAGASALGIKVGRFITELPEEIIATANELNFPLIQLPVEQRFNDVNNMLNRIVPEQARLIPVADQLHTALSRLVSNGSGIQEFINELTVYLGFSVCYYDTYFDKVYSVKGNGQFQSDLQTLSLNDLLVKYTSHPIRLDKKIYGYLILEENQINLDLIKVGAVEYTNMLFNLVIQRESSRHQAESKYRDEFIHDLLFNKIHSMEEISKQARFYGWKFDGAMTAIVVDIDNLIQDDLDAMDEIRRKILFRALGVFRQNFAQVIYTFSMTNIILIIHCERGGCADELARVAQKAREDIKEKLGYTVTIGVGNLKHSALQIHTSYIEAQQAVEISRKLGKQNNTILYSSLGAYNILSTISQTTEAKNFYTNYLGQLFRFDEENSGELKATLECLVKHDWNMKAAADELFIHYNTMKYRYKKICELLQMDLQEPEQKLNITLSLKLYQLAR